ncbi:invasin domain 3-containing protein [Zophobihabitans entericus]|uniref:Big-1 domain-containing protein n=1 Tax=Zophobihabitans entericus TaxID=1635327 RepID=A0A6G9IDB5_9GAMM|nr:invasin domain 3-containing protein [Zophobihabitans entericus]QIQ22228.1 hypothetical protein IPMB12_11325 [Zophobihabitans entericus]
MNIHSVSTAVVKKSKTVGFGLFSIITAKIAIFLSFIFLTMGASSPVYALNTTIVQSPVAFDCKTLYASSNGTGTSGSVYSVDLNTGAATRLYYPTSGTGYTADPVSTIALGRPGGKNSGNSLTMYHWSWAAGWKLTQIAEGETEIVESPYNQPAPGSSAYNYWSGGEVNQKTGEIYFTSGEDAQFRNNFRILIFNPQTGAAINSGLILPKTPTDSTDVSNSYIASDMAIDADGNAYVLVGSSSPRWLVRVIPGGNGSGWVYNKVRQITGIPTTSDMWGMAFVDGKLYVSTTASTNLYRVDVLTGVATVVGTSGTTGITGNIFDLASCQTAPVIKGKVYNDTAATGAITGSEEGISNINVEIWKEEGGTPVYKASVQTDGSGEYSYIVDSTNATYYIRLVQPTISSNNAMQTWASAGGTLNPVTAYCSNGVNNFLEISSSGVCYGAKGSAGYDQNSTSINLLTDGQFVSKIVMTSDDEVADASFGLTTVRNYGDAPNTFGTLDASNGAAHVNGPNGQLYLGNSVSIQSDGQPTTSADSVSSHDGVFVIIDGAEVPLQDAELLANESYTFKVIVNGTAKTRGYLNAWIGWNASGATTTFTTQMASDLQDSDGDGVITFNYTIPSVASMGYTPFYTRFRISSTQSLNATGMPQPTTTNGSVPWVVDGEVEDYRSFVAAGFLELSAKSVGGVETFTYAMTNIGNTNGSTNSESLTTVSENTVVEQSATSIHAFDSVGVPVVITQTLPTGWTTIGAVCTDGSATLSTTLNGNILEIPATDIIEGKNISCEFENGKLPTLQLDKSVVARYNAADQFTVQITDGTTTSTGTTTGTATSATTGVVSAVAATDYTLDESMASGSVSTLNRYSTLLQCTNTYTNSSTTLPSGNGQSFTVTPSYGDVIACILTNSVITPDPSKSTITADPLSITADGTTESTITVQLKDTNGNNLTIGGDTVAITVDGTAVGTPDATVVDNNDGTYSIKTKSTTTGADKFVYTVNTVTGAGDVTVTYVAGAADPTTSTIVADPTNVVADGTTASTVTVQLKDAEGNNLTTGGDDVTITVDGTPVGTATAVQDNGDGTYSLTTTSTVTGADKFIYTVNTVTGTGDATVTYETGVAYAGQSTIVADPVSITADGTTISTITVQLKDEQGNNLTVGGDDVEITIDGTPVGTVTTVQDNGDGTYSLTTKSSVTGVDKFVYTVNTVTGNGDATVTYVAGAAEPTTSTIVAAPTSITADGTTASTITVQLKDAQGNNLTTGGDDVTITVDGTPVGSATAVQDNGNGTYTITTTSTVTGADKFVYTVNTVTGNGDATVTYVAGAADATTSTIVANPTSITADGSTESIVTVQLKDAQGNNLTTGGDTVLITTNATPVGTVTTIEDNLDGTYTIKTKSTVTGTDTFIYSVNGDTGNGDASVTYTPGVADASTSTIVAAPTSITADGTTASTITVQLKDTQGNNLTTGGDDVTITVDGTPVGSATAVQDNGNGTYTITTTSTVTGADKFVYTVNTVTGNGDATVTYVAGAADATTSTIVANPTSITADGTTISTVTVQLKDAQGNNLTAGGDDVTITVDGTPVGSTTAVQDNGNGTYTLTTKSTVTGIDKFVYTVNTVTGNGDATVTYIPGAADASTSTIVANPTSITADGVASSTVTVQLKDAQGNNLTAGGDDVTITVDGTPVGSATSVQDNGNGTYTITTTSTVTGVDKFVYTVNTVTGNGNATVTYVPGAADATTSTISANPTSITADGITISTVTVQLKDGQGNNLTGGTDTVEITAQGTVIGTPETTVTNNGNGTYSITTKSTVTGTDTFGFTVNTVTGTSTASVTYTAGAADAAMSTISANPSSIVADGVTISTVTVQLKDQFGNNLIAGGDTVTIYVNGAETGQPDTTVVDNGNGTYSITTKSTVAGTDDFIFTVNGDNGGDTTTVTYLPGAADATKSLISANPTSITADGVTISTVTVQLRDQFNNNLITGGDTVDITVSGTPIGTQTAVQDNNNGKYTITTKSTVTGTDVFEYTVNSDMGNGTASVTYLPGAADPTQSIITADPVSIEANGVTLSTVTVQLRDQFGNNLTTSPNTVVISVPAGAIGNVSTTVNNNDGTYRVTTSSTTTGTDTFAYTVDGTQGNGNATVTYISGGADPTQSVISANPATIVADNTETSTVTVQLRDQYGNNLTIGGDTVTITVNGTPVGTADTTAIDNGNGTYSITTKSTAVGTDTFVYTVNSVTGNGSTTVTYVAGTADASQSAISANPSTITADNTATSTVTVQLKDQYGNSLTTGGDTVTITVNGTPVGTADTTVIDNGNGTYSITTKSTAVGVDTFEYTVNSVAGNGTTTVTYVAGAADPTQSVISANPTSITANGSNSSTITVQLKDQYGNELTVGGDTVLISVNGTPIGTLSNTADRANGTYTATVTSTVTGTDVFEYTVNSVVGNGTASVTYVHGLADATQSIISANPTTIAADGVAISTVTVQVRDSYGNNLTIGGDTVTIEAIAPIIGTPDTTVLDNGDGTYKITTKSTAAGLDNFGYTVNGVSGSGLATVNYEIGAPDASQSLISASPTSITADGVTISTVTVQLRDSNGNDLINGGDTVTITVNGTAIGSPDTTVQDHFNGTYTITTKSTVTGTDTFDYTVNGDIGNGTADVTYVAGPADPTQSSIIAYPTTILADGATISSVGVQLRDQFGNNLTTGGDTVNITVQGGTAIGLPDAVTLDNHDGTYFITTKSTVTGTDVFEYTVNGSLGNGTASVTYVVGVADPSKSTIVASPTTITADGTTISTVTVQLKDIHGNNLTAGGDTVTIPVQGTAVGTPETTVNDNGDGTYSITTKSTVVGTDTFEYTVNGVLGNGNVSVIYVVGAADPNTSTITANPTDIFADGSTISTITVQLKDAQGNNLTTGGDSVSFFINGTQIGNPNFTVQDHGNGSYTITTKSTVTGTDNFGFSVNGVNSPNNADVNYITDAADPNQSIITASPTEILANGSATSTITVQLRDQYGNNLTTGGDTVVIFVNGSQVGNPDFTVQDHGDGTYTITTKSTVTGTDNFGFSVNGVNSPNNADVNYVTDAPDATTSTIIANPTSITADGVTISTITVQLKDANNNNVTDGHATVTIFVNGTAIGTPDGTVVNHNDGTYTITTKSTVVGSDNFGFTVNNATGANTATVTYVVGAADATTSTIEVFPTSIIADGVEEATITVRLKDAQGNSLTTGGDTVTIIPQGTAIGTPNLTVQDNGDGSYSITTTSTVTGSDIFGYTVNGATGSGTATVAYLVGVADPNTSTIAANPTSITADGSTRSTITVQLKDAQGNDITVGGDAVQITVNGTAIGLPDSTTIDNGDGTYSITTRSIVTGTDTFGFSVNSTTSSNTASVIYTSGIAVGDKSLISATPTSIVADNTETSTITVQLRDINSNNLTTGGDLVTIYVNGTAIGTPDSTVQDNNDGTYSITTKSTVTGTDVFEYTVNIAQGAGSASVTYLPGAAVASQSTIVAAPDSITADNIVTSTVTVQLKDIYGNNLITGGDTVTIATISTAIGTPDTTVVDQNNGTYTITTKSITAGTDTFGFTVNSVAGTATDSVTYTSGPADPSKSEIVANPTSITADGVTSSTVTVTLKDQYGNRLTTGHDSVEIFVDGTPVGSQSAILDHLNGTYTITTTSTVTGTDTFGFTVYDLPGNGTASVTYTVGAADASQSLISATPASIVADNIETSTITVQLRDQYGNNLTTGGNTVTIITNGTALGTPDTTVVDHGDGTYSITTKSTKTGTDNFIYTVDGINGTGTAPVTYLPGTAVAGQSVISASPTSIVANNTTTSTVRVQLRDQYGNNLITGGDTVTITVQGTAIGTPETTVQDHGNGTYTITTKSTTVGTDTFEYTVNSDAGNGTANVTYTPGVADPSQSIITANPVSITANGTTVSTVTVQLRDQYGNDLVTGGNTVLISIDGTAIGSLSHTIDRADGTYIATVTSTVTGVDTFKYTVDSVAGNGTTTVTYVPGIADATQSTIVASPTTIIADNIEYSTITVKLYDAYNNALVSGGDNVTITTSNTTIGTPDATVTDHGDGTYTIITKSTVAGTDTFVYTVNTATGNGNAPVTYTAGPADPGTSTITANPTSILADGSTTSTITVRLKDQYGNNLPTGGDSVTIFVNGTAIGIPETIVIDHNNGTYSINTKSTVTGTDIFNFTVNGAAGAATASVTYTPGVADITTSTINANPVSITADGVTISTITVQLKDVNGNNLTTGTDIVEITVNGTAVGTPDATTVNNGDGTYTITTKSTVAGTDTFGFTLNTVTSSATASVTYLPGAANATVSTIVANPTSITADGVMLSTITVQLKDQFGNNLTGGTDTVTITAQGTAVGTPETTVTNNGNGTYSITTKSTVTGTDTFGFTVNGAAGTGTATVTYTAGAADGTTSTIVADPTSITADGVTISTITVQLKDAQGNNLVAGGDTVTITAQGTAVGTPDTTVTDVGNGTYTITTKSTVTGTDTFGFTVNGTAGTGTATVTYLVGAADGTTSTIVADPTSITADGVTISTITVQLKDAQGNNLVAGGDTVTITAQGTAVGTPDTTVTDVGNGTYTITTKSTVTGTDTFGFMVNSVSGTATATVTYTAGTAEATTSTIVANPTSITADGVMLSTITVQLKDQFGNNLTGGTDTVTITAQGTAVGTPETTVTNNGDGTYSITTKSTVTGTDTFGFTVNGAAGTGTATVTYTAGAADGTTSTIVADPTSITADGVTISTITVQLKDAQGNNLVAGGDTVTITAQGTAVGTPDTTVTDVGNGTYTITTKSTVTGTDTFGFTVNSVPGTATATVTYTAGTAEATTSTIVANPASITADGVMLSTITVQLKDQFGNNLTGGTDTVTITAQGTAVGTPETTVTNNGDGTYSITTKSTVTGTDTFGFTVNGAAGTGTATVTYTAGAADGTTSTIVADPTSITADGVTISTISVQLKDTQGNNLVAGGDTVTITAQGTAVGTPDTTVTDVGNGTYTITTKSTVTGTDTFGFTVNGTAGTGTATVTYTAGAADITTSTIVADPTSITADGVTISTITVQLKDAQGNNLVAGGDTVTITAQGTAVGTPDTTVIDVGNGTYTITTKSTVTGTDTFGFTVNSVPGTATATVTYTAGTAEATTSTIVANPASITADGVMLSTITVQLKDQFGNNLTGGTDTVTITAQGTAVGTPETTVTNNGDGTYSITTKSTITGTDTFGFTVNGAAGTGTATVTYTAGAADGTTSTIVADPTSITADGVTISTITVQLKDAQGNNLTAGGDTVTITAQGTAVGTPDTTVTDVGNGTYTITTKSTVTGTDTFGFTVNSVSGTATATVTYTAGAADGTTSTIVANPASITADGVTISTITVQLKDAQGNNLVAGGDTVTITAQGTAVGTPDTTVTDVGNGTYTITTKSTVTGTDTFGFTVNGVTGSTTAAVTYIAGAADGTTSTIVADPTSITADGVTISTITVQLKDAQGNNLVAGGDTVTITAQGTAVGTPDTTVTDVGNGTYTITTKSTVTGTDTFGFTVNGAAGTGTATVTYTAGAADGTTSTIVADPTSITADGVTISTITVQLKDAQGNNLVAGGDTVTITAQGTAVGIPDTTVTDVGNGTYTITTKSTVTGTDTFGFTVNGVTGSTTATVTYIAGAADITTSTIVASPTSITADGVTISTITVQLKDAQGNNLTTGSDTVTISVQGTAVGTPDTTVINNGDGTYTITTKSTVTGTDTFGFTINGTDGVATATVTYTAGAADASTSTITAVPTNIVANGSMTSTITVQLKDAQGNNLTTGGNTVTIPVQGVTVGNPDTTVVDNGDGTYSITTKSTVAGSDTFGFTVDAVAGATTATVTYEPGVVDPGNSLITANPTTITADGVDVSIITVQLRDANGNNLTDGSNVVEMQLLSHNGLGQLTNLVNNNDGSYTMELRSTRVGFDNIAFTVNNVLSSQRAQVTYVVGPADANMSIITANPTTITADGITISTVTVQLLDATGNYITTGGDSVAITVNGTAIGTPDASTVDNGDGTYSITTKSTNVGTDVFGYTVNSAASINTASVTYEDNASLRITLKPSANEVKIGDLVRYTARIENVGSSNANNFTVINSLPDGFSYVNDSVTTTSSDTLIVAGTGPLSVGGLNLNAGSELTITFILRVGAGVSAGTYTTTAEAFSSISSKSISNRASADVVVTDKDPLIDESLIFGTVYHDRNGNRVQDKGEPGIPGVKIISVEGLIIETDQYGRYHLEGISGGKWSHGRNFILKVDPASLPTGAEFTTNNPLVRRITPGLPVRFDFGVKFQEESILEVSDKLFTSGAAAINPQHQSTIADMAKAIEENQISEVIIITKVNSTLATQRAETLKNELSKFMSDSKSLVVTSSAASQDNSASPAKGEQ